MEKRGLEMEEPRTTPWMFVEETSSRSPHACIPRPLAPADVVFYLWATREARRPFFGTCQLPSSRRGV